MGIRFGGHSRVERVEKSSSDCYIVEDFVEGLVVWLSVEILEWIW